MMEKFILIEVIEREVSTPVICDTCEEAYAEMYRRVMEAFDTEDITVCEEDGGECAGTGIVMPHSAYGERHGQNYDWKIFEVEF